MHHCCPHSCYRQCEPRRADEVQAVFCLAGRSTR
nr:MAG TPA_asm: hypothetical protein [Caudoviricetes sp.]